MYHKVWEHIDVEDRGSKKAYLPSKCANEESELAQIKTPEKVANSADVLVNNSILRVTHKSWFDPKEMANRIVKNYRLKKDPSTIMDNLIAGLSLEQIEALKSFYESQTGLSAKDILAKDHTKTREQQLRYIFGIMKNRFFLQSVQSQGMLLLDRASKAGVPIADIQLHAKSCGSWTHFRETIEKLCEVKEK